MPETSAASALGGPEGSPLGYSETRRRLWLEFVNTGAAEAFGNDLLHDFEGFVHWLVDQKALDAERAAGIIRRSELQPAAASAVLSDARKIRCALRGLAERGANTHTHTVVVDGVAEINRVLGRSAGTRRIVADNEGLYHRAFVPTGDAFAGLMIPIAESAADSLVGDEMQRVRRCANARCHRVFYDTTRNGLKRWCDMETCGNRAKAARHRARLRGLRSSTDSGGD